MLQLENSHTQYVEKLAHTKKEIIEKFAGYFVQNAV